ncbi:MAG: hypothetical protein WCP35_07480 [Verrucomicrobiota bacterium]
MSPADLAELRRMMNRCMDTDRAHAVWFAADRAEMYAAKYHGRADSMEYALHLLDLMDSTPAGKTPVGNPKS